MTMLGSSLVDFPPSALPQPWLQCRLAPLLLADQHLRRLLEQAVVPAFEVACAELWGETRGSRDAALARQVAMYLAHVGCGLSLTEVGRLFARDRTTVAHACERVEDRRESAPFDRALELLEGVLVILASRPA
jgi:Bacterial dnaA protein helix-turn-helix